MAQLYFRYGAMNSGKSIEVLKVAHNYEEQNKAVRIFTSGVDDRDGVGVISSRTGMRREAIPILEDTDIFEKIKAENEKIWCILIDEAQFLTKENVLQLTRIVDELNIPVMAFGLKNDFMNNLFEGSKYLLLYAEKIEEIKTICWYCAKKATMNLRMSDGKPVYEGTQIQIGGNESYFPVCRYHYFNPVIEEGSE
ncbi:thymidine kinase [Atopostipes suicloacalis DSM 15692]|uniref:Thymidine kinase n=1 Tax=Atopostipes suicloacalis DSM 15692 TaxID=1121025 RepID=A0A1M4U7K4_9LACT|nr:thymidine kinase [Atopostipes suicloacalis]SHE52752.1 thymidine kinase [Atopostipes suicloacalis DSM 15692]